MITKAQKDQWLIDLRSGNFKQGKSFLKKNNKHCCLGVLAERLASNIRDGLDLDPNLVYFSFKYKDLEYTSDLPNHILNDHIQNALINFNDIELMSFSDIADWIELNVETEN